MICNINILYNIYKRYGKLERGGQLNLDEAAKQVLNDWNRSDIVENNSTSVVYVT